MENQKPVNSKKELTNKLKQIIKTIMYFSKKHAKSVVLAILIIGIGTYTALADGAALPQAISQLEEAKTIQAASQFAVDSANKRLEASNQQVCIAEKNYAGAKVRDYHNNKYELQSDEDLLAITKESQKDCGVLIVEETSTIIAPEELYYPFLKSDRTTVSQSPKEHFKNNGYMATDIATNGRKLNLYAPSFMFHEDGVTKDEAREYTVKLAANYATMGETIELHWKENGVPYNWAIGHTNQIWVEDGDVVKTGEVIGLSGGCPGELKLNEVSTGCHIHEELWIDGQAVEYPLDNNTKHNDIGFDEKDIDQVSTSYRPVIEVEIPVSGNNGYDISKLAYAIAQAETNDCTTGMGKTKNNCFGIMEWPGGLRQGIRYTTKDDSYAAFSELWQRSYDTPLIFESVFKWVYGPRAERTQARIDGANQYLSNALFYYNQ